MSLPDGAEYWQDVKAGFAARARKHVFLHRAGVDCGHYHIQESARWSTVDCPACLDLAPADVTRNLEMRKQPPVSRSLVTTEAHASAHTEEQLTVLQIVFDRINAGEPVTVMAGAAGTGKTTLMHAVGDAARVAGRKVIQMTPTGKAAVRLQEKTGQPCQTIHSALYGGVIENQKGELEWIDPGVDAAAGDLIIIDEASMVGEKLLTDILGTIPVGVCTLFVGDPFQLPPVNDGANIYAQEADVLLTTIHRQALDHPILALATSTRLGQALEWLREYKNIDPRLQTERGVQALVAAAAARVLGGEDSIVLCYTNDEKQALNDEIRKLLDRRKMFEPGDRIIIRTNNHKIGVMNGEIFTVETARMYTDKIWGKYALIKIKERKTPLKIALKYFGCDRATWWDYVKAKPRSFPKNYVHADYGFAITVHSSQGSEWDHALLWWEPKFSWLTASNPEEARKLLYTAVTRAASTLTIYR